MNTLDDLLLTLRETVPQDDEFQRRALAAARQTLSAQIAEAPTPRRLRWAWRPGRLILAGSLSLAVAALILLVPTSGGGGRKTGGGLTSLGVAPASADAVLLTAARSSVRRVWRPLSAHRWLYYRFAESDPNKAGQARHHANFLEDEWLASDGGARVVQYANHDVLLVGPARAELMSERALQRRTTHFQVVRLKAPWPPFLTFRQIVGLPASVGPLRRWVTRRALALGGPGSKSVLAFLTQLVIDPRVPPKVDAALYRIISRVPGVTFLGKARDPLGRAGTAVGFSVENDTQTQLIFNLRTGRVLAVRDVSLGHNTADPPRGTVLTWRAVSNVAVVQSDRQLPG